MINNELQKRIFSSIILIPTALFFIIKGSFFFNFFLILCLIITLYEWYMMSKKKNYHFFGYLFLLFSFYSAYFIRNDFTAGSYVFLAIMLICISTDIGGYVFGKIFRGPKLTKISPKKTYAGVFGGYLLSIIFIYIFNDYLNENFDFKEFILVIMISTISQLGDIVVSYFKRLSKIKDTGKIIPGHGGILDRIDGMIFAFPFYFIIYLINLK
tara:strand:- start:916 stop:1551 length:636 start_codon:yes stop_codon:yes gene_type:complete